MPTCFGTTPDFARLLAAVRGETPDRVPLYEFFSDTQVQMRAIGDWPMDDALPTSDDPGMTDHIRAQYYLGYDYLISSTGFGLIGPKSLATTDSEGNPRGFQNDQAAPVQTREDFDAYDWPTPERVDYSNVENCAARLPDGMKVVGNLGGGLLEWGMWLMGAEHFCLTLYDDPDLVRDLLGRVLDQQVAVASVVASHPDVFMVAIGDDMGFKTQTFLPPAALREFIFPGLKRIADAVHAQGKPFVLHSCGNLTLVMDDLIDDVGIQAKHSFEDVIMPVTEVKSRWGDRVALLGGVDVDILCRATEKELRRYVRNIVETCGVGGGFALGSGNSIANYIPPQSLRVMLDEAISCQRG